MDQLINGLIGLLGIQGVTVMAFLAVLSVVSQMIGKLIPDDATGVLGIIRKITKVLGLYVSNRIETGVSVNDAARAAVHTDESRE